MEQLEKQLCLLDQIFAFLERGTGLGEHSRVPRQLQVTKHLSATTPRTLLAVGLLLLGSPCGLVSTEFCCGVVGITELLGLEETSRTTQCHIQCLKHFTTSLGNSFQC